MTKAFQPSSIRASLLLMLKQKISVASIQFGKALIHKSGDHSIEDLAGRENNTAFPGENHCCAIKPERKTIAAKNSNSEFSSFFSKLYAGIYEIK